MDERPEPRPEGILIAEALARSGISIRQAAKLAGISYGRWRQITSGVQNVSPGEWARVKGPPETVARMAFAAGVTPAQLREAGRADAAGKLAGLQDAAAAVQADPAARPDFVSANWDDRTVRLLWEDETLTEQARTDRILFYLAILAGTGKNKTGAVVTELRRP